MAATCWELSPSVGWRSRSTTGRIWNSLDGKQLNNTLEYASVYMSVCILNIFLCKLTELEFKISAVRYCSSRYGYSYLTSSYRY